MAQQEKSEIIGEGDNTRVLFTCWNCKAREEIHLKEIQQERIGIKYTEVRPSREEPKRYFVRCPGCDRFTSIRI